VLQTGGGITKRQRGREHGGSREGEGLPDKEQECPCTGREGGSRKGVREQEGRGGSRKGGSEGALMEGTDREVLPGKEEQESPRTGCSEGEEDDLGLQVPEEAARHAHQDQHTRYVEDELGGCAPLKQAAAGPIIRKIY
jgi:hypothetical protein